MDQPEQETEDRARFPNSILWKTDCPSWHWGHYIGDCKACVTREKQKQLAQSDPTLYHILLRVEGYALPPLSIRPDPEEST